MNNDQMGMPSAPAAPKKNNTTMIIVIAVVVLCCCCAAIVLPIGWYCGDMIMGTADACTLPF